MKIIYSWDCEKNSNTDQETLYESLRNNSELFETLKRQYKEWEKNLRYKKMRETPGFTDRLIAYYKEALAVDEEVRKDEYHPEYITDSPQSACLDLSSTAQPPSAPEESKDHLPLP